MRTETPVGEHVVLALGPYVGAFNAEVWVKVVAQKRLGVAPQDLRSEHLGSLLEGLGPSLRTMMGRAAATELAARITKEVG